MGCSMMVPAELTSPYTGPSEARIPSRHAATSAGSRTSQLWPWILPVVV